METLQMPKKNDFCPVCWPQYRAAARKYATLLVDGPFNSSTTSMLHFCACTARETRFCFVLVYFFLLCFCICFWLLLCVWGGGNDANFNNNWSSTSNNKSINNNLFWTIYIERERETNTILKQLYWYCSYPHIFNTCAYVWLYICIGGCWYLVHMHFIRKLWAPWEVNYLKKVW